MNLHPASSLSKRYTPEFKKLVVETMQQEQLGYSETARRFEVNRDMGTEAFTVFERVSQDYIF